VSQNSQMTFTILGRLGPGPQGRAEQTLVSRNRALDLPAVLVETVVKTPFHLSAVFGRGPFVSAAPGVQRDQRGADTKLLSTQAVIMLTIVSGIGNEPIKAHIACRLDHRLSELGRVVGGTPSHDDSGNQMGLAVTDDGQLWPATPAELLVALAVNVVGAGVSALQARGVDGPLGTLVYQTKGAGALENCSKQLVKSPFFRRRFSA